MSYQKITSDLKNLSNPVKAKVLSGFFKTGKGQYSEGDKFMGITVPKQRELAKKYYEKIDFGDLQKMLQNKIHEYRLTALFILVYKYNQTTENKQKKEIYNFYIKNLQYVNNWDLVDVTTPNIVGDYLLNNPNKKNILYKLVKSKNLWERRVAILATFSFIKEKQFEDSLEISKILLCDTHDLIHKAVGWMLREIGKKDIKPLEKFLNKNATKMPRTMLRYAIEKFPEDIRQYYLKMTK
ncbi:MAG: DNA alkylation repair protein [Candidatus Magasanikbacteria bacterium CG_4_10_14_0_8_um_filter_32_14]|uniref:DNA alkylation repair protein n=2 Tax=Candidatus Magasanikiibacteriota TaxID=1752731 RepID=A0A2M7R976_9BACT|nr:MAG: DNA alkylation repair protein [Candidatus Magasanikbacteria bacterium CG1_02_32_51]PIY93318.1 MAG: DNA alkylation repair protein [Candidatus Magasanikbacteria bacterium CG_4_10_14_0_8_um_filter_32_14]